MKEKAGTKNYYALLCYSLYQKPKNPSLNPEIITKITRLVTDLFNNTIQETWGIKKNFLDFKREMPPQRYIDRGFYTSRKKM